MVDSIDEVVQGNHDQGSQQNESELETKTKKGFLETVGDFTPWDWAKIATVNVAAAAFGGGLFGMGAVNVAATTFSYVFSHYLINRKEGFERKDLRAEFYLGGAVVPALDQLVKLIDPIQNPVAYWGAYTAILWPFVSLTHGLHNLFKKYEPSTFISKLGTSEPYRDTSKIVTGLFEKETIKDVFKVSGFFGPALLAVHFGLSLPSAYLIPVFVPFRIAYRYITGKTEKRKEMAAAQQEQPNPTLPQPGMQPSYQT